VDNFILCVLMFEKKGILNCGQFYTVCCVIMVDNFILCVVF